MIRKTIQFNPVVNRRTFEDVSLEIKKMVFQGILKPGDKLPNEMELAGQFKVGRQTIREALRILELSGFIAIQKGYGGGPVIKDTILNRIGNLYIDAFQMERVTIGELTKARLLFEQLVVKELISIGDEETIFELKKNVASASEKIAAGQMATDENIEFHLLLAKATKNQVIIIVLRSIMELLRELLSRLPPDLDVSEKSVRAHEKIVKAITSGNEETALSILCNHLKAVEARLSVKENTLIR